MSTIPELEKEMTEIEERLRPLLRRQTEITVALRTARSRLFIELNRISKSDVEMSDAHEKPYFGHIQPFIDWLRRNSAKDWVEWNGRIYRRADLLMGRMTETPAYASEL